MPPRLPTVAIACICEKVLREEDGVLSVVRIVDSFTVKDVSGLKDDAGRQISTQFPATALVTLRSDGPEWSGKVSVKVRGPRGDVATNFTSQPVFVPAGRAANLIFSMSLRPEPGNYAIELLWEETPIATLPFTVTSPPELPSAESRQQ